MAAAAPTMAPATAAVAVAAARVAEADVLDDRVALRVLRRAELGEVVTEAPELALERGEAHWRHRHVLVARRNVVAQAQREGREVVLDCRQQLLLTHRLGPEHLGVVDLPARVRARLRLCKQP